MPLVQRWPTIRHDYLMKNYFKVLGLEPLLNVDLQELEERFHDLSRKYHPDFHTNSSPEDRARALEMTALLNDAYRTLREPTRRAEYLVRSQGFSVDGSKVPRALLAEVFEINEELEQLRTARQSGEPTESSIDTLEEFRSRIRDMREEYDGRLRDEFAKWDVLASGQNSSNERREQLAILSDLVSTSAYIRNLERDIEMEVSQ
jgi:molecular chaperone HscB